MEEPGGSRCNSWVERICRLNSPQVTIIGGKDKAYFQDVVQYLPDPVIYDEYAQRIKKLLNEIKMGDSREETK